MENIACKHTNQYYLLRMQSQKQDRLHGNTTLIRKPHWNYAYQTAVLDLLDTELSEAVWVVSQVEGVEGSTRVQAVKALNSWSLTVCTVGLSSSHQDNLQDPIDIQAYFQYCRKEQECGGEVQLGTDDTIRYGQVHKAKFI